MVGHQAVRQQPRIIARDGLSENALERGKVLVSLEDGQPGIRPVEERRRSTRPPLLVLVLACSKIRGLDAKSRTSP